MFISTAYAANGVNSLFKNDSTISDYFFSQFQNLTPLKIAIGLAMGCLVKARPQSLRQEGPPLTGSLYSPYLWAILNRGSLSLKKRLGVAFCIVYWENPAGSNSVGIINSATKAGWLPPLLGLTYGWNLVIVVAITAFIYVYLRYSKQGYEIAYVGQSVNTARYAGINVKTVIIRTMAISGALCGLAGFILVSGAGHTISTTLAGGRGFTAIVVAWLSKLNTFTMMIVSFLLTFMAKGAIQIASQFSLNENASEIITGIILFFVLGCEFFINYKVEFRHRHREG